MYFLVVAIEVWRKSHSDRSEHAHSCRPFPIPCGQTFSSRYASMVLNPDIIFQEYEREAACDIADGKWPTHLLAKMYPLGSNLPLRVSQAADLQQGIPHSRVYSYHPCLAVFCSLMVKSSLSSTSGQDS